MKNEWSMVGILARRHDVFAIFAFKHASHNINIRWCNYNIWVIFICLAIHYRQHTILNLTYILLVRDIIINIYYTYNNNAIYVLRAIICTKNGKRFRHKVRL